jgi:hypothetical protein
LCTALVDFYFDLDEVIFQQDNSFVHKARTILEWFWKQPYSIIKRFVQSPNHNSIEYVWAIFKWHLNLYRTPPKNCGTICKGFMPLSLYKSVKGCMLACLLKLQLFWKQKEGGKFLVVCRQYLKTKFLYILNFKMMYFVIHK